MATIIENLLEEIWIDCPDCSGFGETTHWHTEKDEVCLHCKGKGKTLSDDGAKLRYLIYHGEMP